LGDRHRNEPDDAKGKSVIGRCQSPSIPRANVFIAI
jgi:hypothetical protein